MLTFLDLSGNGSGVAFLKQANSVDTLNSVSAGSASAVVRGLFNAGLSGTFVASLRLERSFDNGVTWRAMTALGESITFTAPCQEMFDEPEGNVLYRWYCFAYTSGTIVCRISQ